MGEFEVLHESVQVVQGHCQVVYQVLNVGFELVVVLGGDLSLINGSWAHKLHFLCLNSMGSKGHNPFRTC